MVSSYMVHNVPLIPQDNSTSCWYACARMVIQWRREQVGATERFLRAPGENPLAQRLYQANYGLQTTQRARLAQELGLQAARGPSDPTNPSPEVIGQWLHRYGPLMTFIPGHVVVIAGISEGLFWVHDPAPDNNGSRGWRPFSFLDAAFARDAQDVRHCDPHVNRNQHPANYYGNVNFLHCPRHNPLLSY